MTYSILKNKVDRLVNDRTYAGKRYFDLFMMSLVISSVVLLLFEIETRSKDLWGNLLLVDDIILVFFVVEYLLRLWVCSSIRKDYKRACYLSGRNWFLKVVTGLYAIVRNKAEFMIQPMSIIDLLAIMPLFRVFRVFRIFRLLRLFKLVRYSHSMESLFGVFREKVFELSIVFGFIAIVGVASATFVYVLEREVPGGHFQSLSDAVWWSFVTITTVGYGDKVPVTDMGRIVAVFLMLCAIASIALPSGILASAMTQKFTSMKDERLSMRRFKNHIVVCGWNNSAEQLMRVFNKHPKSANLDIVTATLKPLDEIDSKDVIVRPGDFTKEGILNDVNIIDASYVLVVAEELHGISDESIDARSFLACNLIRNINPDIYIIAQLLNMENAGILRKTVNNIEIVVSDDITGGLLSSSIVTPGTSKLVNSLITHSQDNIVKLSISKLDGTFRTFHDLWTFCRRPSCNWLPLAVERDGEMFINPKDDHELEEGDNMYYIQTEMDV